MSKVWTKIDDADVQGVWKCENDNCDFLNVPQIVAHNALNDGGIPICSCCGDDLEYSHTEILK